VVSVPLSLKELASSKVRRELTLLFSKDGHRDRIAERISQYFSRLHSYRRFLSGSCLSEANAKDENVYPENG